MLFLKNGSAVYHLIYSSETENAAQYAKRLAGYLSDACGIEIVVCDDSKKYDHEIWLGMVNRPNAKAPQHPNDFKVVVADCHAELVGERFGLVIACMKLAEMIRGGDVNSVEGDVSTLERDAFYLNAVQLARSVYGTYGSWLQKQRTVMTKEDLDDISLVDALVERLGDSLVLEIGSSSALYNGYVVKNDRNDYSKATKMDSNGNIWVAEDLAKRIFGEEAHANEEGYVHLTMLCAGQSDWTLFYDASVQIAIVTPKNIVDFQDASAIVNGHSNATYLKRIKAFFHNPVLPEPTLNIEQTRREMIYSQFGTDYIFDYTVHTYDNYYSPAILAVTDSDGERILYASHEVSKLCNHKEVDTCTLLKRSIDGGDTWELIGKVDAMRWATLFELDGKIYLEGNERATGNVQIAVFDPQGGSLKSTELALQVWGSAPCAVAFANERIYLGHNGAVISANTSSDLLKTESWTVSNNPNQVLSRELYEKHTGKKTDPEKRFFLEEGNVVVGNDGQLYAIYRIDATPTWGHAAIFRLSEDGKTLSMIESCDSIIDFPSNQSKFMIKRDKKTGFYITFTSLPTADYTHQRNVLAMAISKDLFHWSVTDILLVDRQMLNTQISIWGHAFQYVDFDFVDDDILLIVRESTGDTCTYHDGTCVTLYLLRDYVDKIKNKLN